MAHANADVHKSLYLSDESVAALPYARGERGVYVARDTELTGFRCIVNRNSKRLVYQGELREGGKRHTVYERLGDPAHVKVGLGCVDVRFAEVEPPERIAERVEKALAHVTADRLWLNPDCGFAPGKDHEIPLEEAYAKLKSLGQAGRLLRERALGDHPRTAS